jgi:hypothetical protein
MQHTLTSRIFYPLCDALLWVGNTIGRFSHWLPKVQNRFYDAASWAQGKAYMSQWNAGLCQQKPRK